MNSEKFKQAFQDMADEMERACGDWRELPETEMDVKLRERIMAEVKKREQQG